jgi:Acyltransferase C-terminus
MEHTLLPRSTGLQFILRTLGPAIPGLQVLDVTIGYPGVPAKGYGQDYYTLRSIFFKGIPPPKIHVHLRLYPVSSIPIGNTSGKNTVGHGAEASPEETAKFDSWLRERWTEKDRLMDGFYRNGKFSTTSVEVPVKLLSRWEALDAYAWFAPVIAGYLLRFAGGWVMGKFAWGT